MRTVLCGAGGLWRSDLKLWLIGSPAPIGIRQQLKQRHSIKHDEHIFAAQLAIPVHNVFNQFVQDSDQNVVVTSRSTGFISITRISENFTILLDPMLMAIKPNTLPDRFRYCMKQRKQIVLIRRSVFPISRNSVCGFQMLMGSFIAPGSSS